MATPKEHLAYYTMEAFARMEDELRKARYDNPWVSTTIRGQELTRNLLGKVTPQEQEEIAVVIEASIQGRVDTLRHVLINCNDVSYAISTIKDYLYRWGSTRPFGEFEEINQLVETRGVRL